MQTKRFWQNRAAFALAVCVLCVSAVPAAPYEFEDWNCPTAKENYWCYWDESYDPYPPPDQYNYHNRPMNWEATGGVRNTGYVWTPLEDLHSVHDVRAYWPAYMFEQVTEKYGVPNREIDLTIDDAHIRVAVKDVGGAGQPVNLHGAKLYFWVGYWWVADDPAPDSWAFFYNANGHFTFDSSDPAGWTTSTIPVGEGTTDWGIISMSGMGEGNPAPPVSEAWELFVAPQQWGFVIFDPDVDVLPPPSGALGFDNWAIIPEPSTLTLLALGVLVLLGWRRPGGGRPREEVEEREWCD